MTGLCDGCDKCLYGKDLTGKILPSEDCPKYQCLAPRGIERNCRGYTEDALIFTHIDYSMGRIPQ